MLRFAGCGTSTFPRTRRFHATFNFAKFLSRKKAPSRATSSAFAKFQQGYQTSGFVSGSRVSSPPHYDWRFHATFIFAKFQPNMRSGS